MPCCQALESLIWLRYFENAPTVGLIDISLSLTTMSICVWRWPMSLSASSERPLISAASPTTTAIRSSPWRRSRASASPSAIERPGAGMPAVEHVVRRLRASREAADAIELAKRPEPLEPARQQLVRVGLVAGVPDDPVARRLEQPVERDRELHDPERRAQVAAGDRDGLDDRLADLQGELGELDLVEAAQVGGPGEIRQDRHGGGTPVAGAVGARVGRSAKPVPCRCARFRTTPWCYVARVRSRSRTMDATVIDELAGSSRSRGRVIGARR